MPDKRKESRAIVRCNDEPSCSAESRNTIWSLLFLRLQNSFWFLISFLLNEYYFVNNFTRTKILQLPSEHQKLLIRIKSRSWRSLNCAFLHWLSIAINYSHGKHFRGAIFARFVNLFFHINNITNRKVLFCMHKHGPGCGKKLKHFEVFCWHNSRLFSTLFFRCASKCFAKESLPPCATFA